MISLHSDTQVRAVNRCADRSSVTKLNAWLCRQSGGLSKFTHSPKLQVIEQSLCSLGGPLRIRVGENQQYIALKQVYIIKL